MDVFCDSLRLLVYHTPPVVKEDAVWTSQAWTPPWVATLSSQCPPPSPEELCSPPPSSICVPPAPPASTASSLHLLYEWPFWRQLEHSTRDQSVGLGHSRLVCPKSSQLRHWTLAIFFGSGHSRAMWPSQLQFLHLTTRSLSHSLALWPASPQFRHVSRSRFGQSRAK
ncbi:hypothetical protein M433DRAFT_228054 [Acidomyces richmondensis BFW]|nr:hypothetical protein M433DRAFT_228054 [Acidomyces richmondensis BFW]